MTADNGFGKSQGRLLLFPTFPNFSQLFPTFHAIRAAGKRIAGLPPFTPCQLPT